MTLIVRHAGAPILGSETSNGPDVLEFDISAIHDVVNGDLTDENFSDAAMISGLKLASASLSTAKLGASEISTALLALNSVITVGSSVSSSSHSGANGSFSQILTVPVSVPSVTGVVVILLATFRYAASLDASAKSFRIDKDSSGGLMTWSTLPMSTSASDSRQHTLFAFNVPTPGSTPTYSFDVRHDSGTLFANVVRPALVALCLKR